MTRYGKIVAGLIAAWFVFALTASALHLFTNNADGIGVAVGIAAAVPVALFAVWFATSEGFRRFALSLNPRALAALHSWRIVGFTFVLLEAHRILPALFAMPAGYGDMFIGMTATWAAWKLAHPGQRRLFIFWNLLGLADLVTAVTLGTTARLLAPDAVSMLPMTVLPLSLVPTFLVPLLMILHIVSIAQARGWSSAAVRLPQTGKAVPAY